MTGSLMISMVEMKPNIAFAISIASCFAKIPDQQHTKAVIIILQYLKDSIEQGITYGGQNLLLVNGYSNSDWAGDKQC